MRAASPPTLGSGEALPGEPRERTDTGQPGSRFDGNLRDILGWVGWRRRLLALVVLVSCLGVGLFLRGMATTPMLDLPLSALPDGGLAVATGAGGDWAPMAGKRVTGLAAPDGSVLLLDAHVLHRSPRWQPDGQAREQQVRQQAALSAWLDRPALQVLFADGTRQPLAPQQRGWQGVGLLLLPLALLSLMLVLCGAVVALARPNLRTGLYLLMCLGLALNLLAVGAETLRGLGPPAGLATADLILRLGLDVVTAGVIVQACALPGRGGRKLLLLSAAGWTLLGLAVLAIAWGPAAAAWWAAQGLCLALAALAVALLRATNRRSLHPYGIAMERFALMVSGTLVLLTLVVAWSPHAPVIGHGIAVASSVAWYLLSASLLLLMPFLARSHVVLREFARLAAVGTLAASVDLLLVTAFALSGFTALAIGVCMAVAAYAALRQRAIEHLLGGQVIAIENVFGQLLVAARELQMHPDRAHQVQARLLGHLFGPLAITPISGVQDRAIVRRNGGVLIVPLAGAEQRGLGLALRHAQRGHRLFTRDDARLADRLNEQLQRAVDHERAVEKGRSEERQRLAQDLHDDIGARLLTLMYQAPTPEMENYIRHTLQDLKTLTRGLAASSHTLSEAAADWKADLLQRTGAARAQLVWQCAVDADVELGVVPWSALTRILRELVSNALFHGRATRVDVQLELREGRLRLRVADDGAGHTPDSWSHGLGLGGVRKRVKTLRGTVEWRENVPRGIVCEVIVPSMASTG